MTQHVFVAMPYGNKQGIDFNRVYSDLIKPALKQAGFQVFRADEERRAGDIRVDMFQELLLADLVVVDLSIDNPNVWYELGVRHALRSRGVIQIQCARDYLPFDVYVDRTLRYHVKDGQPDSAFLDADKKALGDMARETVDSWHGRKISPVYQHLHYLEEPGWKSLRVDAAKEFWEAHDAWEKRIDLARKRNRPGDILVLAEELPIQPLRLEAYRIAGKKLLQLGQFQFALDQYERALAASPTDLESQQQKGLLLGRLKRRDEAMQLLEAVVEEHPDDAESWALLGRVEKESWIEAWRIDKGTTSQMVQRAANEDALLRESIRPYVTAFTRDPRHYYSGINAVTLMHLLRHLTGRDENSGELEAMEGGVRWAVKGALARNPRDYWARVTLADLEVLVSSLESTTQAYKNAVAVAEKNWFALDSSRQQLLLLNDLGFRPEVVGPALSVFDDALGKLAPPEVRWEPRLVFLFSGHMIDAPNRPAPRFPPAKEQAAAKAIEAELDELGAGASDLALCGGACGGDLLFAEASLKRGVSLEVQIPFDEPTFLKESVMFAGESWRDRFYQVKANSRTRFFVMPNELGPLPKGANAYGRNNLWQLYTSLAWGTTKVRFISLWDGKGGDGPGGTRHMHDAVLEHSGQVHVIDVTKL